MNIRYLSDLHLEFTDYRPERLPGIGEDLVVLCGDIAVGTRGIQWAQQAIPDRPVICVLGNHEYYGHDFDALIIEAKACAQGTHVHVLENDAVQIGRLRVLGCTLWTDFACFGIERQAAAQTEAWLMMSDYELIRRHGDRPLTPKATAERCQDSRAWLDREISRASDPLLVVTHMAPSLVTMNPKFEGDISNGAFHNAFDDLIRPPVRAWIHGHTHWCAHPRVNGIPLLTNQRGYPGESTGDFSWDRCIELDL